MTDPARAVQVPQDGETPVRLESAGWITWRYAYARAAETAVAGEPGQDYLAFAVDETAFVFALCDGVSQSFYGDLAARLLGDALCDWLAAAGSIAHDRAAIAHELTAHLEELTGEATRSLANQPLPETLPLLVRDVLVQKRGLGSESTFVCGRIERPKGRSRRGRLLLAWLGDSRLRVWSGGRERLGADSFHTAERWSSTHGVIGRAPHVYTAPLLDAGGEAIERLAAYSDGLGALDGVSGSLSNFAINDLIDRAAQSSTSDDISFIELWLTEPPAQVHARPLPAPRSRIARGVAPPLLTWSAVPGASGYEVEERAVLSRFWRLPPQTTLWSPPSDLSPFAQLRVRARLADEPGQWSAPVRAAALGAVVAGSASHAPVRRSPAAVAPSPLERAVAAGRTPVPSFRPRPARNPATGTARWIFPGCVVAVTLAGLAVGLGLSQRVIQRSTSSRQPAVQIVTETPPPFPPGIHR